MTRTRISKLLRDTILVGGLVLFLWLSRPTTPGRGLEVAVGEYDDQRDYFEVAWGATVNETEVNTLYPVEVYVSNFLQEGSMYVRCRFVPRNSTWLPGNLSREVITYLPTGGTCLNDAYGQTARVDLASNESVRVPFTLITPSTPDIWALSCMPIERCWKNSTIEGTDFRSDNIAFLVNVTPRGSLNLAPTNATYLCTLDQDCDAYNLFGPQRCISGRCVDAADLPSSSPMTSDGSAATASLWTRVTQWARLHRTASTTIAAGLGLVGLIIVRRRRRR